LRGHILAGRLLNNGKREALARARMNGKQDTSLRWNGKKWAEITQKFSGLNYSNYANFFRKSP